ncbi:MAG: hypothetical protein GY754_26645 [bacterium]|nr:hypothetical protein [bacterium]
MMELEGFPLIIAIASPIAALYCLYKGFDKKNKFSLLNNTPTTAVENLSSGFFESKGTLQPLDDRKLESPLSNAQCLYYRFLAEEKIESGKSSRWVSIIEDEQWLPLALDDGTGKVELDLQRPEFHLKIDHRTTSGTFNEPSDKLKDLMKSKYNTDTEGWFFNKELRYEEKILREGDPVYAIGDVVTGELTPCYFTRRKNRYIISNKSEESLLEDFQSSAGWYFLTAAFFIAACAFVLFNFS